MQHREGKMSFLHSISLSSAHRLRAHYHQKLPNTTLSPWLAHEKLSVGKSGTSVCVAKIAKPGRHKCPHKVWLQSPGR